MLFIALLMNFSVVPCAPYGFALLSRTSGRVDLILGNYLMGDLDLILVRSLNSKSEKNNLNLYLCFVQKLIFGIHDL
jgi:hypothetical protein